MPRSPVHLRALAAVALSALAAEAAPGRSLNYAESQDRLVYAFVFGHRDTCRVIRRATTPEFDFDTLSRRRPGADWRGEPGETVIAEFAFGRGRPLHIVPLNGGELLVAFVNRPAEGGWPTEDRIHHLAETGYAEAVDYAALPADAPPAWPEIERALPHRRKPPPPPPPLAYSFLARETAPGRLLVGRQSEGEEGLALEMVVFALDAASGKASLPTPEESARLLEDEEDLYVAGAAWALGHGGEREAQSPLRTALARVSGGPARAAVAQALVRCGEPNGRKTLRALLAEADRATRQAAALALAELPPSAADDDALAEAAVDDDAETARLAGIALAGLGGDARAALERLSRSGRAEKRAAAARILGRIDDAKAEERLLVLARDSEETVQTAAARALTQPPRAIHAAHHEAYGRALLACARAKNAEAARRLSLLAYQARIGNEETLRALVECAEFEPKAIWALGKLTGEAFGTAEEVREWWRERKK